MIETQNLVPTGSSRIPNWASGASYVVNDQVMSPANFGAYVRKTNGAGTTDPSLDTTNWKRLFGFSATKEIGVAFNAPAFSEAAISDAGRGGQLISYISGTTTANVYSTMFSFSGAISVSHFGIYRNNNTSKTWGARITVDGEVIFERSSALGSTSAHGRVFAGKESESAVLVSLPPIVATNGLLIEWVTSVSETNGLVGQLIYQELQ